MSAIDQEYSLLTEKSLRDKQVWSVDRRFSCDGCAELLNLIHAEGGAVEGVTVVREDLFIIVWYRYL